VFAKRKVSLLAVLPRVTLVPVCIYTVSNCKRDRPVDEMLGKAAVAIKERVPDHILRWILSDRRDGVLHNPALLFEIVVVAPPDTVDLWSRHIGISHKGGPHVGKFEM